MVEAIVFHKTAELVRAYHCSRTTADKWVGHHLFPGFPCDKERFDRFLDAIGSPYGPKAVEKAMKADTGEKKSDRELKDFYEAYYRQLKCEELELELARIKGEMIRVEDIAREHARFDAAVCAALDNLPRAAAQDLVGLEHPSQAQSILEKHVDAIRDLLARSETG